MLRKITTLLLFCAAFIPSLFAQTTVTVSDADFAENTDYYWTSDNTYVLDDMVFIKPGSRLFIEPGTVVQGELGNGNDATGLVITRGAQIFAEGTPNNPIIFTSVEDDGTLTAADRGLWGGVILLGAASTNNPSERLIEGVNEIASPAELAAYGGDDDMDNSGVMRYVSIRHTGINVGDEAGNEIQGLTMGGVGAGTTLEFIESFASDDDGFEWFGGTVNSKYLVSAFNTDDAFDWDEGYRGKGQFWFAIQDESDDEGFGRAMELDGAIGDENTTPFGGGWVVNATILGAGETLSGASNQGDGSELVIIRDNSGGRFINNIFAQQHNVGITVEDVDAEDEFDSRVRLSEGDLVLENNLWYNFGAGNAINEFSEQDFVQSYLSDAGNGNRVEDPGFLSISRTTDGGLDPRPAEGSPAWSGAQELDDPFFTKVPFVGAFGGENWLTGWTAIDEQGYVSTQEDPQTVTVSDADFAENTDYYWTSDNTYVLDDMVFIKPGSRLFIEPGTVVQGELGNGNDATGLVITRGAQIFAEGTPNNPIIFTSVEDDGTLTAADRGLWGGVILLGAASTNNPSERLIEGVNEIASPAELAAYGGDDDMDNSGVMRYVSIRHTGINVGDEAGNEIQGLTMGGVGAGTTLEFIESFASDDDGFEWFGGTVNSKYLVSAFNTDDAFDWDEGYRGKGQFWFAIQDESDDEGFGRAMELDGAIGDENTTPFGGGWVVNATILGAGETLSGASNQGDGSELVIIRDNSGGRFINNIFAQQHNVGITVEDVDAEDEFDSRVRLSEGDLVLENNLWYNFGAGNAINEFSEQDFVQSYLSDAGNGNRVEDPGFLSISRTTDGGLDPRPAEGSPAWSGAQELDDEFFDNVSYVGAFGLKNWLIGWTAIDEQGYVSDNVYTDVEENPLAELPTSIQLNQNYPNPFNPTTQISFTLPQAQQVTLKVYDMLGREVATLANRENFAAGSNTLSFDAGNLSSGIYIYRLTSGNVALTKKMSLIK